MSDGVTIRWQDRRSYLNRIKTQRGCVDCGYSDHPAALDFDHIDPADKAFAIGSNDGRRRTWGETLAEIEKCVVRCANCHRIRSAEQMRARWAEGYRTGFQTFA